MGRDAAADRRHAPARDHLVTPIVEGRALTRMFPMPSGAVTALREASIEIAQGDYVAITGPSGCGKSTLLHLLGCVDSPTSGSLLFEGHDAARLSESARSRIRLTRIGFIFQRFFLLPMLDAWENVELPQAEIGVAPKKREQRTRELLEYVGLSDRAHHRPAQLSGGEMQRVAIARALANHPALLLADEPTGELDSATAADVFGALQTANRELGVTVLIVTHDPAVSSVVSRVVAIRDGRTSTEIHRAEVTSDDGEVAHHAVEYAVLDRAGRLQLPKEMTEPLGMRDLVRLEGESDHIGVWPDDRESQ
jgi:putative ABC transport system ATP-binding protein